MHAFILKKKKTESSSKELLTTSDRFSFMNICPIRPWTCNLILRPISWDLSGSPFSYVHWALLQVRHVAKHSHLSKTVQATEEEKKILTVINVNLTFLKSHLYLS